jgi:phosphate transport system substrate-binding protein
MSFNLKVNHKPVLAALAIAALTLTACTGGAPTSESPAGGESPAASPAAAKSDLTGSVAVDGSSTVFPISEAMAEEFKKANPGVNLTVSVSGTGGGFKKFCAGETDISNASRPIKKEEIELCEKGKIEYVELPIAFDGLSVVVNPKNNWAKCLKVEELKTMWEPAAQGKITKWNQVNPSFPDKPLQLFGAGTDSGTYDYFTKEVVGEEGKSRGDYTASEDDNTLVQGVAGSEGGLAFFGYAYYEANKDQVKPVEIDGGNGCVIPSPETIADGSYKPLSRPEFIYVKKESLSKPEVKAFVEFQLSAANKNLITQAGYVPFGDDVYAEIKTRLEKAPTGSMYAAEGAKGKKLIDLLKDGNK